MTVLILNININYEDFQNNKPSWCTQTNFNINHLSIVTVNIIRY